MIKLVLFSLSLVTAFGQGLKTDTEMTTQANVIRNETVLYANTKGRIADMHQSLIDSKVNLQHYAKVIASGTTSYTATITPVLSSYFTGFSVWVSFTNSNTGAATINFNSVGIKNIYKNVVSVLSASDLVANKYYFLIYDGTNFQISLDASGGFSNPMTTSGDIISATVGGSPVRLGIGSAGQVLTVSGSAPAWANSTFPPDGDYGDIDITGSGTALNIDNNAVSYGEIQNVGGSRLVGRYSATSGDMQEISVGSGLTLSTGGVLSSSSTGVSDGDKGDITVSGSGATFTVDNDVVTYAKMQNITGTRLSGRYSASSGDMQEIILGTGLSFTSNTLNNTLTDTDDEAASVIANRLVLGTGSGTIGVNDAFRYDVGFKSITTYSTSTSYSSISPNQLLTQSASNTYGRIVAGSPETALELFGTGTGDVSLSTSGGNVVLSQSNTSGGSLYINNSSSSGTLAFASNVVGTGNTFGMVLDNANNLDIGNSGAAKPSNANFTLILRNGATVPTTSASNGVILYSQDAASSAELKVRDEAGNITTLSPHNFTLTKPSEPGAWSHYSEFTNSQTGDREAMNVDMLKMARMVETLWSKVMQLEEQLVYKQKILDSLNTTTK